MLSTYTHELRLASIGLKKWNRSITYAGHE